jgi:multiple sugar transport system permease protein
MIQMKKTQRTAFWFLMPAAFLLCALALFPMLSVFWISLFRRLLIFHISRFVWFNNYSFLIQDSRFWNAFGNTVYFTAISVILELALGIAVAVLLNREFRGKGAMRSVILVPWAIPTVVSAKMWEWIFNADFGILNHLLGKNVNWLGDPAWALHAAILVDVWKTIPFVAILLMAGLETIPNTLYEAAQIDGASPWSTFIRITLPLLKPLILICAIFRTLDAFRVFDVIYVLTGGGPANSTETLSVYAYKVLFQTLQFGYGSSLAVVVFLSVGLITIGYMRILRTDSR